MSAVNFSKNWNNKLLLENGETIRTAKLVSVTKISPMELAKTPIGQTLLRLDTGYENLMKIEQTFSNFRSWEIALLLTFHDADNEKVFTTIRSFNPDKELYYRNLIGQELQVSLGEEK